MDFRWMQFGELDVTELYDILRLREQVFVVEQKCIYLDCDGLDKKSWHLSGYLDENLITYLRVLPPGLKYTEVSFGRVATSPSARNRGHGKALIAQALKHIFETFGTTTIRISAQTYLKNFYENFGFKMQGAEYIKNGIPHNEMLLIE